MDHGSTQAEEAASQSFSPHASTHKLGVHHHHTRSQSQSQSQYNHIRHHNHHSSLDSIDQRAPDLYQYQHLKAEPPHDHPHTTIRSPRRDSHQQDHLSYFPEHYHHSRQSSPTHPSAPAPALDFEARPSHLASFSASYTSFSHNSRPSSRRASPIASPLASPLLRSPLASPRLRASPTKSPLVSPSASGHNINQKIPFASHVAAANLQAFAANARVPGSLEFEDEKPDDFYRSFGTGPLAGSDAVAAVTTRGTTDNSDSTADLDPMEKSTAATTSPTHVQQQTQSPTSPRSPLNGALKPFALPPAAARAAHAAVAGTTKMSSGRSTHTANPPAAGSGARSGLRSASNPVDDRLGGNGRPALTTANSYGTQGGAYPPSVKDLKKKFDQTGTSHNLPSSPSQRRQPRPSRDSTLSSTAASTIKGGRSPSVGARSASYSARSSNKTTTTRTTVPSTATTATGAGTSSSIATSIRRTRGDPTTTGNSPSQTYGARSRSIPRPRPKLSADDRITNRNSQSFANRISKPRNNGGAANGPASRSLPQLSPTTGLPLVQPLSRSNGLLFGEILPDEQDEVTAGFGIQGHLVGGRPRRTSESSILHDLTRPGPRLRSSSHSDMGDMEPSSPTDWYRGAASALPTDSNLNSMSRVVAKNHSRAHSDAVASSSSTKTSSASNSRSGRGTATTTRDRTKSGRTTPSTPTTPLSSTSRLPVMVKRASISESHGRSSPVSTRSNSPAAVAALKYGQTTTTSGRSSRQQHGISASRAKTPASRSHTPTTPATASTAKRAQTSNRKAAPSNITTPSSSSNSNSNSNSNGRLNAYVSVAAPKLSPSLRSSRPRQSVATASTAASRMRSSVDRPPSPDKSNRRAGSRAADNSAATIRRRKLSVGPIDFAQRRETIKLAYSKTIKDQQAKEAREAAADKRKKDMEAVTRAKAKAEAAALAALPSEKSSSDSVHRRPSEATRRPSGNKGLEEPLKLITNLPIIQTPAQPPASNGRDSPTLGIPGGFVDSDDEPDIPIPQSAISVATAVTEFEEEEQIEAPRPENYAAIDYALGNIVIEQPPSPQTLEPPEPTPPPLASPLSTKHKRLSYHSPFDNDDDVDDDDDVSIEIALDTSVQQPSQQPTPTRGDFTTSEPITTVPAQQQADADEYVPQPYTYSSQNYETTVTILGPENDFRPLYKDQARDTMPPSGLHHADEPPLDETLGATGSGHSHSHQQQQQQREEPRVEVENLERLEDFYIGPHLRDNIASLRDSTYTLSDNGDSYDAHPSATEYQQTPDSSHSNSLAVPAYLSPGNRLSQHSAWTDFSFGSDDQNAALDNQDPRDSRMFKQQADPESPVSYNTSSFDGNRSSLRRPPPRSPEISPLDKPPRASSSSMLADKVDPRQSSEFDRDNSAAQRRIPLVSHQTAPARPVANNYDDLDESTYEVLSRPNSYPHTQDEEEFRTAIISSPPSAGQFSFETVDRTHLSRTESKSISSEATDNLTQEQKRLRQRQLVIRELIDTEEIFVRDMSVVEEIYKGTAEACPQLDSKTIKLIFRNTDDIIAFHASFLGQLRDGAASVYQPKGRKSPTFAHEASLKDSDTTTLASTNSGGTTNKPELDDDKDRQTSLGPLFTKNIDQLKAVHEVYLRTSDLSAKRLIQIQEDDAVKVWLNECSEGAKELTAAWSLDSLLIKPMQRLTKYPDIIAHLLKYTPEDHPDREALAAAKSTVISAIDEINRTKRNFELVGQIVGNRKRKESDVRAGLARAFGKRVDKLQGASNRAPEDEEYAKLHEKFGDEFLRLQVVLRDVEFYTRSASTYVHEFLQYVTSMELVMRLQPSRDYAHIESRWVQFSVSMREMEKILDKHLLDVRKHVIEPFEQVIKCYQNPGLAIKKRAKRRLDYERYMQLKANGKKIDKTLAEAVEQYEALDDTLKKELPKLSNLTAEIGNICLAKFVNIQAAWYATWKEKVKSPLADLDHAPDLPEIVKTFQRDFTEQVERAGQLAILNPVSLRGRTSQSTSDDIGSGSVLSKTRSRPSELLTPRGRGLSINSDHVPSLPTPDVSGRFDLSPTGTGSALPSPGQYYRDFNSGLSNGHHSRGNSTAPLSLDPSSSSAPRSVPAIHATSTTGGYSTRPTTGRSFDSGSLPRQSTDSYSAQSASGTHHTSTSHSQHGIAHSGSGHTLSRRGSYTSSHHNYAISEPRRQSGLFHSALPMDDADDIDEHHEPEAGPSGHGGHNHEAQMSGGAGGGGMFISAEAAVEANVMWLAASLFEFNIETTKHEGGYPYLTYQAGEIFDVVAEKGELWLAKNQDDPTNVIGWIWSKHFAKLAE